MDRPYTVALHDDKALSTHERIAAEVRFASELERTFGAPENVARVYQAYVAASESQANELDRETAALAVQWPQAFGRAARSAVTGLNGLTRADFELRLHSR